MRCTNRGMASTLVLAGALLALLPSAWAQTSTRCTKTTKLDGTGNIGNKTPKPKFKLPGVTVKKCLTVNKKTGDVKQSCRFKNTGTGAVSFIFCNMIETQAGTPKVPHNQCCSLGFDATAKKWKCFPDKIPGGFMHPPSLHFGCEVVKLAGGASSSSTATGQSDGFKGKEAKDFQVAYADIFDLSIADTSGADCGFDSGSCAMCFGANTGTNFGGGGGTVPRRSAATGYWIMSDVPITDPYVRWQELNGTLHAIQYASIHSGATTPSDFPYTLPGVATTFPGEVPPLSYDQDLLLWDIYTMSAEPGEVTPVLIETFTSGSPAGVTVQASPSFALIEGPEMGYGTITIGQTGQPVPEGTEVEWSIGFLNPDDPQDQLWEQDGRAIQDTVPPLVQSHFETLAEDGTLQVSVVVHDATTFPADANFYYSSDGGATWEVEPLIPAMELLDEPATNVFTGTVSMVSAESPENAVNEVPAMSPPSDLIFVYQVQDGVLNQTWFGPGVVSAEPNDMNGVPVLNPTPAAESARRD